VCAAILDNWFGIDRPTPAQPAATITPPPIIANPSAAEQGVDLAPSSEDRVLKAKRRGTSSLKIDRATSAGASGLNIPQA
jgi:hypothetical protein